MRAKRFSKVEMVATAVMIAALAVILWPAAHRSAARGRVLAVEADCLQNAKQIGLVLLMYVQDSGGLLPNANHLPSRDGPPSLVAVTRRYYVNAQIYCCPADKAGFFDRDGLSYNYGFGRLDVGQPPQLVSLPCGEDPATFHLLADFGLDWHPPGRTTLFADGHVKVLPKSDFRDYELRDP